MFARIVRALKSIVFWGVLIVLALAYGIYKINAARVAGDHAVQASIPGAVQTALADPTTQAAFKGDPGDPGEKGDPGAKGESGTDGLPGVCPNCSASANAAPTSTVAPAPAPVATVPAAPAAVATAPVRAKKAPASVVPATPKKGAGLTFIQTVNVNGRAAGSSPRSSSAADLPSGHFVTVNGDVVYAPVTVN